MGLFWYSAILFIGSMSAGMLRYSMDLSRGWQDRCHSFSMGLLVATSYVIVQEGVHMVYAPPTLVALEPPVQSDSLARGEPGPAPTPTPSSLTNNYDNADIISTINSDTIHTNSKLDVDIAMDTFRRAPSTRKKIPLVRKTPTTIDTTDTIDEHNHNHNHIHDHTNINRNGGMRLLQTHGDDHHGHIHKADGTNDGLSPDDTTAVPTKKTKKTSDSDGDDHNHNDDTSKSKDDGHNHGGTGVGQSPHIDRIGLAAALGFLVMRIITHFVGGDHGHGHGDMELGHGHSHGVTPLTNGTSNTSNTNNSVNGSNGNGNGNGSLGWASTVSLGMIIHCAVDGLALGGASSSGSTNAEFVVFLAIIMHKAPGLFGLASLLLTRGFSKQQVFRELAMVSATAPLFAVISSFFISRLFNYDRALLGLGLLFSAGTLSCTIFEHLQAQLDGVISLVLFGAGVLFPFAIPHGHAHGDGH